jgi:hypothetical protein
MLDMFLVLENKSGFFFWNNEIVGWGGSGIEHTIVRGGLH